MSALAAALLLACRGAMTDSVDAEVGGDGARWMARFPSRLPLDSAGVRRGLERMVDSAVSQGFLLAAARAKWAGTDSGNRLAIEASAGGRLVWNRLLDAGGTRTTPPALSRLGAFPAGFPANPADLETVLSRLEMTGYVKRRSPPRIRRIPNTARADAILFLSDIPSSFVEAAGSWTRSEDPKGYAEARLANLAGTARDLDFGISQGEQGISAHAHWKEPWIGPFRTRLDLDARLVNDSSVAVLSGAVEARWPLLDGRLEIGAGLVAARRAERLAGDTTFGPTSREFGSRFLLSGRSAPPAFWPVRETSGELVVEAASATSDTGDLSRLRLRLGVDAWRALGPASLRLGGQGRIVLPLDGSTGLSEALAPGGIAGWRGWPEGSPRSPSWAWLVLQAGFGGEDGGTFAFFEPGVRARRRQDLSWDPAVGWSAGTGAAFQTPSWRIDLVVSARDETRSWQDMLLQARARNRF